MPSYTLANESLDENHIRRIYSYIKRLKYNMDWTDLDCIFEIALRNKDRFPAIPLQGSPNPDIYIERWIKGYYDAMTNLPSKRIANPKSTCTDPAIRVIVSATQGFSTEQAEFGETIHNLFMSAENIQGSLLEEYIALKVHPYGFLWCNGNVLRAIDFCNSDGTLFLQIKNKSNTENSSSSNIREGTTIKKWYRLGTKTQNGKKYPDYKWNTLNQLINAYQTMGHPISPCHMSEEDYQNFLTEKASDNHRLITKL